MKQLHFYEPRPELLPPKVLQWFEEFFATQYLGSTANWVYRHKQIGIADMGATMGPTGKLDSDWLCRYYAYVYGDRKPSNAHYCSRSVVRFVKWCHAKGYIEKDPTLFVKRPPNPYVPNPQQPITAEEYERLKLVAQGTYRKDLYVIAWATGASYCDCCLLTWDCIDLENMICRIPRKKMARRQQCEQVVPIEIGSDFHRMLLARLPHAKYPAYPNDQAKGIYYVVPDLAQAYKRRDQTKFYLGDVETKREFKKAGIPKGKSFRCFRIAMASALANSGCNLALACKVMGHRNPSTFTQYVRPDPGSMREMMRSVSELRSRETEQTK